ncbi:DUF2267 domain-containing protein [Streptomyces sp. NPDC059629]|uniref:DUF2267 domain-containing protein n=1 Tax=Streptomyces sp. NPDC059629 TaxID=3346889 RepID=UPI0036B41378
MVALLGAHLADGVRAQLAARPPEGFALTLLIPRQSAEPLPVERFVGATAAWMEEATEHAGALDAGALDVGAALSTVADAAGDDLLGQILLQLPTGYDLLFGRPRPT